MVKIGQYVILSLVYWTCFVHGRRHPQFHKLDTGGSVHDKSHSATSTQKILLENCSTVRREFAKLNVGQANLVPDKPIYDPDLTVCVSSDREHKSCCTRQTEDLYAESARAFLQNNLVASNQYLRKVVEDNLKQYEEQFHELIVSAESNTDTLLQEIYSIPHDERTNSIKSFFLDLDKYLQHQHVNIYGSVARFFDELFPLVFLHNLNDPRVTSLSVEYSDCLMQLRQHVYPQPFGDIPHRIALSLAHALANARAFLHALSVVLKAVNATDSISTDSACIGALTRLQYCSHCEGYIAVRPCKGFCVNVLRGCFAKVTELGEEWDKLLAALESLAANMRGPYSIQESLRVLDTKVSEAIMHAMENQHRYYPKVVNETGCGHPATIKAPLTSVVSSEKPLSSIDAQPMLHKGLSAPVLNAETQQAFLHEVLSARGLYGRMADMICNNTKFYEQDWMGDECWNGHNTGRYQKEVPESGFLSQVKFNPEVKVSLTPDPRLLALKDELVHLKRTIFSQLHDEPMQGDSPNSDYGSGYYNVYKSSDSYSDDEDLAGGSGSGSGDGYGYDRDKVKGGKKTGQRPAHSDDWEIDHIDQHQYSGKSRNGGTTTPKSGSSELSASYLLSTFVIITSVLLIHWTNH